MSKINISNRVNNISDLQEIGSSEILDLELCLNWNEIASTILNITFKPYFMSHEVVVSFCDASEIQELNRLYRYHDSITDVLSFNTIGNLGADLEKFTDLAPEPELDSEDSTLGDIIICVSQARRQAEELGHSLKQELAFLYVHGFLHLLGYDHELKDEAEQMFNLQNKVLSTHSLLTKPFSTK